jgi:fluoride exporter
VERQEPIEQEVPAPRRWRHVAGHDIAAIFLGGFVGSLLRTALAHGFPVSAGQWPWPTFAVNMLGAALLGYLIAYTERRGSRSMYGRSFIGIGLCGALTTFSTMMVELLGMLESSRWALAGAYAGASIAGGLAAVALASRLARRGSTAR